MAVSPFSLSLRDVEMILAARGVVVSYILIIFTAASMSGDCRQTMIEQGAEHLDELLITVGSSGLPMEWRALKAMLACVISRLSKCVSDFSVPSSLQAFSRAWYLLRDTVQSFIDDDGLSKGASISFYTITSIGPVLFIVVAIAGVAFGEDAARGAISSELSGLMGKPSADLVQTAVQSAAGKSNSILASAIGMTTLLITASGVFGEMQSALNAIWKAEPRGTTVGRLVRARAVSLGLVAALGFLLLVSLVISAILSGLGAYVGAALPFGAVILQALNIVISFALIAALFAAIYKILPDARLSWRDVLVGAVATALLFSVGKFLIGLYLGHSLTASSYGAAGALIIMLLWVYYSAQIFLLGAEFTKVWASRRGTPAALHAVREASA